MLVKDKERLDSYRLKIRNLDDQILQLISERLTIAQEIGAIKKRNNLPIKNHNVEKLIFKRISILAPKLDLPINLAIDIFQVIIQKSVEIQEKLFKEKKSLKVSNFCKSFLIIGGMGKMGFWLSSLLQSLGHKIDIVDQKSSSEFNVLKELPDLDNYDFITICTPLDIIKPVLLSLIKQKPKGTILDIGSLKTHFIEEIELAIRLGIKITSIHPLFGPNIKVLYQKNVIICKCGSNKADDEIKEILRPTHMNLIEIPLEDHDRYMSISLGLSHAINLIFGYVIAKSGINISKLYNFASTTFLKQLKTSEEVFSENPELYYSIQNLNAYRDNLYQSLASGFDFVYKLIKQDSINDFNRFVEQTRSFLP
ncbi:MAG: T-protein [Candidatus Heimdallarchaeota archaeon LC_3]|nr:MAG: T-protein [Candidatus Heimdallarchaeota archaeon LC_3]